MKNIFFRDGILIYYGNPAGYLSEGKVVPVSYTHLDVYKRQLMYRL